METGVSSCAIPSALKHVREAKVGKYRGFRKGKNKCGKERWMWSARGTVSRWSRLNEEWWWKDCALSFCVRVMEKCVVCQFSLPVSRMVTAMTVQEDWHSATCSVFCTCCLANISMFGWPGGLQSMSVVAVFEPVQLQMDFFMQSEECLCQWYSEASSETT